MDFSDSDEEASFRRELRAWLSINMPLLDVPENPRDSTQVQNDWHRRLYAAGYVAVSFPAEDGGRGLSLAHEAVLNEELGRAGAPPIEGVAHLAHAIRLFGNKEQKHSHLPGLLSGRVRWCQGFSEPDAGSDLASLRTKGHIAEEGETFTVNGTKIWTSLAGVAEWCFLLCRTDPAVERHQGLSVLLVEMRSPGIEVTPITGASGNKDFAQVRFDDVVVPAANLLGRPGTGWMIARQLLAYERGPSDINWVARLASVLELLERDMRVGTVPDTLDTRAILGRAHALLRALQVRVQRSLSMRSHGAEPGPEGSIDKLLMIESDQAIGHAVMRLRGQQVVLYDSLDWDTYVWSRAASVYGGTQQIQRNIVAQHVLDLPRP